MSLCARSQVARVLRTATATSGVFESRSYAVAALAGTTSAVEQALPIPGPSNWYNKDAHFGETTATAKTPVVKSKQEHNPSSANNPSLPLPESQIHLPFSITRIPISEHDAVRTLWAHISTPKESRRRRDGAEWHDSTWTKYRALSDYARAQLPVPVQRNVLHQVVPDKSHAQKWLARAGKEVRPDRRESPDAVAYPWERRLQAVIASMLAAESRDDSLMEQNKESLARFASEGALDFRLDSRILSRDFIFVLEHFAVAGYLTGTESVVKEMQLRGLEITHAVNETRLRTLSKWISIRSSIHRKFLTLDQKDIFARHGLTKHSYGARVKIARESPASVPNDVAILLKDLLTSLLTAKSVALRRLSLDLLLRIAKDTGHTDAMRKVLLSGYGFDLAYPECGAGSAAGVGRESISAIVETMDIFKSIQPLRQSWAQRGQKSRATTNQGIIEQEVANISTHALNTIIEGLGEQGDVWKMLTVLEVLADGPEQPSSSVLGGRHASRSTSDRPRLSETFFSSAQPPAEPPLTLSEATRREEESGNRINYLGQRTIAHSPHPPTSPAELPAAASTESPPSPSANRRAARVRSMEFEDYLTPPRSLARMVISGKRIAARGKALDLAEARGGLANSATFASAMHYAAVSAAATNANASTDFDSARWELGRYFAQRALHQQTIERGRFLRDWAWIREVSKLALEKVPVDKETGEKTDPDAVSRIKAWTVEARRHVVGPSIALSAQALAPLYSSLAMSGIRGARHHYAKAIKRIAKSAAHQLQEELIVIIGERGNAEDMELLAGFRKKTSSTGRKPAILPRPARNALSVDQLPVFERAFRQQDFQLSNHLRALRTTLRGLIDQTTLEGARLERAAEVARDRRVRTADAQLVRRTNEARAVLEAEAQAREAAAANLFHASEVEESTLQPAIA